MKNSIKIALAGMLAMSSLGGTAFAQTAMADDDVTIVYMSTLKANNDDAAEYNRLQLQAEDSGEVAEAQAEVTADPEIVAALAEKSIELTNVIDVDTAANGGKVVYVR
ncbi:hypothetical protein [Hoeflea sp.]|uniref:hypothetical protein n=1 Tax=Hoeflea sp. TaxID=1940281 RepID=UPI003A8D12C8